MLFSSSADDLGPINTNILSGHAHWLHSIGDSGGTPSRGMGECGSFGSVGSFGAFFLVKMQE